jgi:hypothetical protein
MTADNMPKSESDDDIREALLNDLDMTPIPESDEEVLASLDDLPGVAFDAPSAPKAIPGWLTDAQEYAAFFDRSNRSYHPRITRCP